ncbi:MAG: hypothetical protein ABH878_04150 [bacterium]
MQWIILAIALAVLYYFFILRPGRLDFWKLAAKYPDCAFDFFQQRDCWKVFLDKPESGYSNALPPGKWDGPFRLAVPQLGGKVVTIYGRIPNYEKSQQEFMNNKTTK